MTFKERAQHDRRLIGELSQLTKSLPLADQLKVANIANELVMSGMNGIIESQIRGKKKQDEQAH